MVEQTPSSWAAASARKQEHVTLPPPCQAGAKEQGDRSCCRSKETTVQSARQTSPSSPRTFSPGAGRDPAAPDPLRRHSHPRLCRQLPPGHPPRLTSRTPGAARPPATSKMCPGNWLWASVTFMARFSRSGSRSPVRVRGTLEEPPAVQHPFLNVFELERLLYTGKTACNHADEVWPGLYLGDQ